MDVRSITASVTQTVREAGLAGGPADRGGHGRRSSCAIRSPDAVGSTTSASSRHSGAQAAALLVERALAVLASVGVAPADVRGYGKGAIVGVDGDREHTAAILHPRFGAPVRAAIGGGADIIPGTKKIGGPGSAITMPIGNKDDRWVFDDMDAVDVSVPDAPQGGRGRHRARPECGRPAERPRPEANRLTGAARVQGHDHAHPSLGHDA